MLEIPTTKERLSNLFYYLANFYDNRRFPALEAVYQFILKEGQETYYYYISVSNGKAESYEGQHKSPSIKIYSSVSVWFDIINGKLNAYWGFLTRKYHIEGSLYYLRQIRKIFGKRFDKSNIPELGNEIEDFEIPKKRIWKKPNKVLVINGSPRQKEGFTYFYLQYLLKGIREAGCEAELVNIYDKNIKIESCRGCLTCWSKTPGKCVIKDDANELLEKVNNAYLIIYAFPLHTSSTPDKLKAFLNRHFVLILPYCVPYYKLTRHPKRNKKEQYVAVFATSGFPQIEQFKPSIETFKLDAAYSHIPLIATILRPGGEQLYRNVSRPKYLEKVLESLKQAGRELIERGKVSKRTLKIVSKIYTPLENWRRAANMYWYLEQKEFK